MLPTAAAGAAAASQSEFVRNSRQSDNPEISALRPSNVPVPGKRAVQSHWMASTPAKVTAA